LGARIPKIWEVKKREKIGAIWTTLDFNREYLWSGSKYQKSLKQVINYSHSHVGRKKMVNFGPLSGYVNASLSTSLIRPL